MTAQPRIRVTQAAAFERPVRFRLPFRFGAATVDGAPQAFVMLRIRDDAGRESTGWAAEMMMPKWFDKNPALSAQDNVDQLRASVHLALDAIRAVPADTAFGLHVAAAAVQSVGSAQKGLNPLIASFGMALADRAVLDALCRMAGLTVTDMLRRNLPGLDARTMPDLAGFDIAAFLAALAPASRIAVRHTVGLGDALTDDDIAEPLADGLPESLSQAIAVYGHRYFKLKVSGDVAADLARLTRIAAVLDARVPDYVATLDGNEQFNTSGDVLALLDGLDAPELRGLRDRLLFLEQPIARASALDTDMREVAARIALEIDESDARDDAFVQAQALGYTGVSSKSCKGFYRALLNRARVSYAEGRLFMSAEDLTIQPGIALQQDLVLAALTGNAHVERNGHAFGDAMAAASPSERAAFATTYPELYRATGNRVLPQIEDGALDLSGTLAAIGLGCAIAPDPARLAPMPLPLT